MFTNVVQFLFSLRIRTILLVLLVIIPAFGLVVHSAASNRQREVDLVQEHVLRLAEVVSVEEEQFSRSTRQLLIALSHTPEIRQGEANCAGFLAGLLEQHTGYANLGAADLQGSVYCSARQLLQPVNLADRTYFRHALTSRSFATGEYQMGRISGKPSINFGYPILDETGQPQGVVFAAMDLTRRSELKLEIQALLPTGSTFTEIDQHGIVLTRFPEGDQWLGRPAPELSSLATILSQENGIVRAVDSQNVPRLFAFTRLESELFSNNVAAIISVPEETAFQHVNRTFQLNLVGLGAVALSVLTVAAIGVDLHITRRVKALLKATNRLASGDLSARTGLGYDTGELGGLANNFDWMAESLEKRQAQLHQAEARYRSLVENIPAIVYTAALDDTSSTIYVSPQIEPLLGFTPADWQDEPGAWLRQLHPDDRQRVQAELAHSHAQVEPLHVEYRLLAKDGRQVWIHDEAVLIRDVGGQALFLQGVMFDITDRKWVEDALGRYAERLKSLHEIDQAILSARTPGEIAVAALGRLRRLLGCQRLSVMMFDFLAGKATILATDLDGDTTLGNLSQFPLAEIKPVMEKLQAGEVFSIDDLGNITPLLTVHQKLLIEGIRASICLPMKTHGELVGALNLGSELPVAFSEEQTAIAQEVADSLAIAIQNARLREAEHLRRQEAETLQEVTAALSATLNLDQVLDRILDHLARVISFDSAAILMVKGSLLQVVAGRGFPTSTRVIGREFDFFSKIHEHILSTQRAVIVEDAQTDERFQRLPEFAYIHGWMGVPLLFESQVLGFMTIDSRRVAAYSGAEARLAQAFANHAAIAMQNARLFAETQRRLRNLAALRSIDLTITSSLDLRFTLDVLLNQVTSQLNVDAAAVLLLNPHTWMLEYAAGRGFRSPDIRETRLRLGEGLAGQVVLQRAAIHNLDRTGEEDHYLRSELLAGEGFCSYFAIPLIVKGQVKGVLDIFHRTRLDIDPEWVNFLEALAGQAAIAIDNAHLFEDLQRSNDELTQAYDTTIEGWSNALDLRDRETEGHTRRVTELAVVLAQRMGISEAEMVHVRRGGLLHDIGKMGIPDSILHKPGALDEAEWEKMRKHPVYAFEMLSPIAYLRPALDIPYCHHEKWDGSGYPRGLKGEEIPLAGRIFALADVWDALCSDRPYRPAWPEEKALAYICDQSGQHFDPKVVQAFLSLREEGLFENQEIFPEKSYILKYNGLHD